LGDVLVGQRVLDLAGVAARGDEARGSQNAQML
jgi:hypothetical protein